MKILYLTFFYVLIMAVSFFGAYSCKNPGGKYTSPEGYDLLKPDRFNMPSSLLEISGIAFYNNVSDTVYSIQDEDGKLFRQKWDVKQQKNMKFAKKGDFEDLAIFNEHVFALKSNGDIFSFPFKEASKKSSDQVKETRGLVPNAEYEGLYADAATNQLYVLCKSCDVDKNLKKVTGYILNYKSTIDSIVLVDSFKLDLNQIKMVNPKLKANLSPSAITRNAKTREWYILSSANKVLVIADDKWQIKAAHKLNSSTFNQPEGITFDKDMNLFISNEGDEVTDGNILKFKQR